MSEEPRPEELTAILQALGDDAIPIAVSQLYDELRTAARRLLDRESPRHTLQATALVSEAYLRLQGTDASFGSRTHFLRAAAVTMRRILINHARDARRLKRGGEHRPIQLEEATLALHGPDPDLLSLDEALEVLHQRDPRMAEVVNLRFFAGCSNDEVAEVLSLSTRTVEREWRMARAWLRRRLDSAD